MFVRAIVSAIVLFCVVAYVDAGKPNLDEAKIRAAIERGIPPIESGTKGSSKQRKCFTCHNQALPVMALFEAKNRGFQVDEANLKKQAEHTAAHLKRGTKNYLAGKGQGGKVLTAGYALWALEASEYKSDEVTTAVTSFLLQYQNKSDHWRHPGNRPPSSGSDFTTSYVALRGLAAFGTKEQETDIDKRNKVVARWLKSAKPADTEDHVFRLRSFQYVDAADDNVQGAVDELLALQHDDGGWSQKSEMKSDVYATSTVLVALLRSGRIDKNHAAIGRGIDYLLKTQLKNGTWHVTTRAKPFQTYYESGFPHKQDQFISITASSWAVLALVLALPDSK